MKVVKAQEMGRIEKLAYAAGASEEAFMEAAGQGIAERVHWWIGSAHLRPKIALLCGAGNNAGDAYTAGRLLLVGSFEVWAFSLASMEKSSPLCQEKRRAFEKAGGKIIPVERADQLDFDGMTLVVDGILGTGFHGKVEGLFAEVIEKANHSRLPILAVDVPSGMAIRASETLFLGLPKSECFLGEAWNHVGKVHVHNFGLGDEFVAQASPDFELIEEKEIEALLPRIERTRHKYQAGYIVGLGGSPGMPGAAMMACESALKAGAGIIRLFHPAGMEGELAAAPYELVREGYHTGEWSSLFDEMKRAASLFIGPGIGSTEAQVKMLEEVLPQVDKPCVIDADALTLLASHTLPYPSQAILTPHHGEMLRLLGEKSLPLPTLLERSQAFVEEKEVTLVLKGAPTFILHPGTLPHVCAEGTPGMATAGSGDVLTGILAAFLAQKKSPLEAAKLGVYFHGAAGEYAAEELTDYCMVATDIIEALPHVFAQFEKR